MDSPTGPVAKMFLVSDAVQMLPEILYGAGSCCICNVELNVGAQPTLKLSCCDNFIHLVCQVKWIKRKQQCPLCREPLDITAIYLSIDTTQSDSDTETLVGIPSDRSEAGTSDGSQLLDGAEQPLFRDLSGSEAEFLGFEPANQL